MIPAICFEFDAQIVCSVGLKLSTLIVSDNRKKKENKYNFAKYFRYAGWTLLSAIVLEEEKNSS